MTFTAEHIRIIEKNKGYYDQLVANGTVPRLSSVIIDEFILVHKEAISGQRFPLWCRSCMIELIESIYKHYAQYLQDEQRRGERISKVDADTSRTPELQSKAKAIPDAGKPKGKNRGVFSKPGK